ncbi:MAG: phytoene desaturase family protein [Thermodesulfobacteriota bacterium]
MKTPENDTRYDSIVVGAGASGMTLALLLAMNGRKVLLVEKNQRIGGSLTRFYRQGIPCDTGFHFTGGFARDGILSDMLSILSIENEIRPEFVKRARDNCFIFETDERSYQLPTGHDNVIKALISYFPGESEAVKAYFARIRQVIRETGAMDIHTVTNDWTTPSEDDFVSLQSVLDSLTDNHSLKTLLSSLSMCYGTEAASVSFADHSRVVYSLYQSIARVRGGGEAFIRAFKDRFKKYGVTVKTNSYIKSMEDVTNRSVGTFVLNDGTRLSADECIFTIHPRETLKTLPDEHVTRAFTKRVNDFERSIGFFSVFFKVRSQTGEPFSPALISLLPSCTIDDMFDTQLEGDFPLVMIKSSESVRGKTVNLINAFEMCHFEHVEKWADTCVGNRPQSYHEYKKEKTGRIMERITRFFPELENGMEVLDAASMLTFRDYLNTPFGCAYGIKQKIGQFNLFGRLPFRNLYAAGQNALLPGVVGTMMSSFILCRTLVGRKEYTRFINDSLEKKK